MRRLKAFFLAIMIFICFISYLYCELNNENYLKKHESIAYSMSKIKFDSKILIAKNLDDRTILVLGSSEFSTQSVCNYHPQNFFYKNGYDFNTMLVGAGHYQSLIHSIIIGALDQEIPKKKLALIISPQWFSPDGIEKKAFNSRYSITMLYNFMDNPNISSGLKNRINKRLNELNVKMPNLLNQRIADLKMNMKIKKEYDKDYPEYTIQNNSADIDWSMLLNSANEEGQQLCTNNDFGIYDDYWNKYIANRFEKLKNSSLDQSYVTSKEYDDLRIFLEVCKEINLEPLIVIIPVNGLWYDYIGFSKKDRDKYYEKIKAICSEYNVEYADFSEKEYEKYFLCDIMHLGWKGWVYVNEALWTFYSK